MLNVSYNKETRSSLSHPTRNLISITECLVFGTETHHADTIGADLSTLFGKCRDTYLLTDSAIYSRPKMPTPDRIV